ncbi:MAG TPA: hypothetical protein VMT89_04030 [Candidatus Acidoferrales bacterium]|nr:hypothetical protein [Candidatus Acidoferrales bacterium]
MSAPHRSSLYLLFVVCCLWSSFWGCTIARYYEGTPLQGQVASLKEGQSTRSDVLREFGPPTQIMHQTNGEAFVYTYLRWNYSSLHLRDPITGINWFTYTREFENRDRLLVVFDFGGIVRNVAIDHRADEIPSL